ncbi:hypothetical protein K8R33_03545 [archaeon]|nr:hypothetical protein [archaeon]
MKKEVSDRVVIILLIFAIVFSIGGTIIVYESVQDFKENVDDLSSGFGSGTGMVTLNVIDEVESEGEFDESIK